ncbi:MAG: DUF4199 domain-containing protein [Bacteroidota bacterium]
MNREIGKERRLGLQFRDIKNNPPILKTPVPKRFDRKEQGVKFGIIAGLCATLFLVFLNANYDGVNAGLRFAKYLFIIPPISYALSRYKRHVPKGRFFKSGFILGMICSISAAGFLAITNIVLAFINPEWAFDQFMHGTSSIGNAISNSVFLAFEVFVFGMIISFANLQFLKGSGSTEDGV